MTARAGWDAGLADAIDTFVADRTDELVELVRTLVGFNTVSVD